MEKRYVSIWLPHAAIDWHIRKQPQLKGKAFVLKASSHNRLVVTAASTEALREGIYTGMVMADAKAIHPSLIAIDDKPGLTEQLLQRMAEWCIRFTPIAAPDHPDGIILDATGCSHLWGGEEAYLDDIIKRFASRGYRAAAAMAGTPAAAWALARFGDPKCIVPPGQQLHALMPLPVAALKLDHDTIARLHKLGLTTIKDLLQMQRSALRRRFSPELILQIRKALGEQNEVINPVYIPEPFCERLPCLEPIQTRGGIEIALEQLLKQICTRLSAEGKGLRKAVFRCYRIDGHTQGIEIGTNRATHYEAHLFQLFSIKLDSLEPAEGIELFLLEASSVEDLDPQQEELWETGGGLLDPRIAQLMDRISNKTGEDVLQRFLPSEHYWPERAYQLAKDIREEKKTDWKLDRPRPLFLLSPPERIEVTAPVPDYPPMLFRHKGKLHRIIKADGPERIEQEWWIQEGEHRDYYSVEDEEGARYWLFRSGHYTGERKEQWFLHGYF